MHEWIRFFGGLIFVLLAIAFEMAAQFAAYAGVCWSHLSAWLSAMSDFLWEKALCVD